MLIALQSQGARRIEALEGLVTAHLMLRSHFEGTNGRNLAVVLNSLYNVVDAVDLHKVFRFDLNLFRLRFIAVHGLLIISFLLTSGGFRLISIVALGLGRQVFVRYTFNEILRTVDEGGMLVVQIRHALEGEVIREAPVEFLLRELEHSLVDDTHGNVVIGFQSYWRLPSVSLTGDLAPKK